MQEICFISTPNKINELLRKIHAHKDFYGYKIDNEKVKPIRYFCALRKLKDLIFKYQTNEDTFTNKTILHKYCKLLTRAEKIYGIIHKLM